MQLLLAYLQTLTLQDIHMHDYILYYIVMYSFNRWSICKSNPFQACHHMRTRRLLEYCTIQPVI